MRECTFNVLMPGRVFTITVTTKSGELNSSVSVLGRTGERVAIAPVWIFIHNTLKQRDCPFVAKVISMVGPLFIQTKKLNDTVPL